jgi:hypothetical protein
VAFVAVFLFIAYLCVSYRPQLPMAQAYIRAATLPILLAALAVLFGRSASAPRDERRWQWWLVSALVAVGYVYFYVDVPFVHRVGAVPATVIIWLYRAACVSAIALLTFLLTRLPTFPQKARGFGVALGTFVLTVAYFDIDRFTEFGPRFLRVAMIATGTIVLASQWRDAALTRQQLGRLAAVGILAMTAIQFAIFHRDYRSNYRMRRAGAEEGAVMRAFDAVLGRPDIDGVPAIYLADPMERPDVRDVFWRFALLKHGRAQWLERTVSERDHEVNPARVIAMPPSSLVVTGAAAESTNIVDQLVAQGVVRKEQQIVATDGRAIAWILRRSSANGPP